jgi:S1-C subfamily serine protease
MAAGLLVGDVLLSIDDKEVASVDDVHRLLSNWPIRAPLTVRVKRGQETIDLRVYPGEAPI